MQHSSRWQCDYYQPQVGCASDNKSTQWHKRRPEARTPKAQVRLLHPAISDFKSHCTIHFDRACRITLLQLDCNSVNLEICAPCQHALGFRWCIRNNQRKICESPSSNVRTSDDGSCVYCLRNGANMKLGQISNTCCCQNNAPNRSRETVSETQRYDRLNRKCQPRHRLSRCKIT